MAVKVPFGALNATIAKTILGNAPAYTRIIEPFGDGGTLALILKKRRPSSHLVNIENPELFAAISFAQGATSSDRNRLKSFDWIGSQETFDKVSGITAVDGIDAFYKFWYVKKLGTRDIDPEAPKIFDMLKSGHDSFPPLFGLPLMSVGLRGVELVNVDPLSVNVQGGFAVLLPGKPEHIEAMRGRLASLSGDFFYGAKVKDTTQLIEMASNLKNLNVSPLAVASIMMASYSIVTNGDRKSTRLNSSHTDISRMPSSA